MTTTRLTMTPTDEEMEERDLAPIEALSRDLKRAAVTLSPNEARYLVDLYYQAQEMRKAADNQIRSMSEEPHDTLLHFGSQFATIEGQIKRALASWQTEMTLAQWAQSVRGIGPVLSAGLLAHVNIERAPSPAHVWRYAGLDPTVSWGKGQKRPWNAQLKTLCWKIGESFVKAGGFYGDIYRQRKELEIQRNENGEFADQAEQVLATKNIGKSTEAYAAYSKGKLPPAHIHARAKRYAVKLFIAHWWQVAYELHYQAAAPTPYAVAHLGHVDIIDPPGWPME